jgi:hypothetical protein
MEIEYALTYEDSFTSILFATSQSPITGKRRTREQYIYPAVYLIMLSILFHMNDFLIGILIAVVLTSLWISFYPYISRFAIRRKYFRNSGKHKNSDIKTKVKLKADKEHLTVTDESGESKITITDIDKIIEIKNYFFLRINAKAHLIIPKNQFKESTLDVFIKKIQKLSKADITKMPDWKWG